MNKNSNSTRMPSTQATRPRRAPAPRREGPGASAASGEGSARGRAARGRSSSSLMRYASDSRLVRAIYDFTCGPYRLAFYLLVAAAVGISLYFPARDLYTAYRASDILERQMAIRKSYNDALEAEVDGYLSKEGIEAAAREQGMVMPGEKTITVTGVDGDEAGDEEGKADGSADGGADAEGAGPDSVPKTSAEAERAEQEVYEDSPWYFKALDAIFMFDADQGRVVASTGDKEG